MDCNDLERLTTKTVLGSALFWRNLHNDGEREPTVLHAGLPVKSGVKVGLNPETETLIYQWWVLNSRTASVKRYDGSSILGKRMYHEGRSLNSFICVINLK